MPKALLCPSDTISIDWQNKFGDGTYSGVLVSYAYNVTDWPVNFNGPIAAYYLGFRIIEVKQPSAKISFIDGIDWWATYYGRSADYHIAWDTHGQMSINDYRNNSMGTPCWGPVIYRHNEGANCGFYDGHVKYMKKQVIYNPSSLGMWSVRH